jgi:hypothetical protein
MGGFNVQDGLPIRLNVAPEKGDTLPRDDECFLRTGHVTRKDCPSCRGVEILLHDRDTRGSATRHNWYSRAAHAASVRTNVVPIDVDVSVGRHNNASDGVDAQPNEGKRKSNHLGVVVSSVQGSQGLGARLSANRAERRASESVGCLPTIKDNGQRGERESGVLTMVKECNIE